MKNFSWKKTVPYIVAIVLFLIISFVYFSPVIEGKVILGHDTQSYLAGSQEMREFKEKTGEYQFWSNSMFGGMPTYMLQNYPGKGVLQYLYMPFTILPRVVFFLFLYLICAFLLLRSFKLNNWLSIAGAFLIAFASYNFIIIAAGHNTKVQVMALILPLIGSVALAFRGQRILGAILTALFLGLAVFINHLQILYYALFILILFFVAELVFAIKEKKIADLMKTMGFLVAGAIVGIALNAAPLMTTYEYSKYTMRGESNGLTIDESSSQTGLNADYITQWSYGIDETLTLLIPNFKGGASSGKLPDDSHTATALRKVGYKNQPMPLYWGTQPFTSGPVYVGAITCFLFVLGLFIVKGRYKWWLLSVTVLSVLLAWGHNFMPFTQFFIDYVPLYNKFRAVSMTLIMAGIAMPLLGLLALKEIFDGNADKEKLMKSLAYSSGIVGGICMLFWIFPSLAGSFISPADAQLPEILQDTLILDRKEMLSSDAFRSLAFILLSASVLYFAIKNKLKTNYAIAILAVLFLFDLYPVAKRYLNDDNFVDSSLMRNPYKASVADKEILQDKDLSFRVLNLTVDVFNDAGPSYFHKNTGGYTAAKLRRYQELINIYMGKEVNDLRSIFSKQSITMEDIYTQLENSEMINMMNTKYFILNPNASPLENPFANGNAWLVERTHFVENADEEMTMLGKIDTKKEVVANISFADADIDIVPDSTAYITLTSYEPMELRYNFKSATDQMAVFSEIYYDKGWNAYISGEKVPYIRANYLLRAMPLKAGEYEIVFKFEPTIVKIGDAIAIAASVILLLSFGLLFYRKRSKVNG